jgi:23S rRNA pseudouridine1911/1915/1917 synthase
MAHSKAPLLGDPVYGATTTTRLNRFKASGMSVPEAVMDALKGFHRQALHAMELVLVHPSTGEFMAFSAPLPDDLIALETALTSLTKRE